MEIDNRFKHYTNCEITDVYQKLPTLWHEYLIKLRVVNEKDLFPDYHDVFITSHNLVEELEDLKNGKKERLYLAYGMTNIDIYKRGQNYLLENSPNDNMYLEYELSSKQYDKLINDLKVS